MRISRLDKSQVDPEIARVFDAFMKERGNVPNMFRTVAHCPKLLRTMLAHFNTAMEDGTLSRKLKELLFVRVSQINKCEY